MKPRRKLVVSTLLLTPALVLGLAACGASGATSTTSPTGTSGTNSNCPSIALPCNTTYVVSPATRQAINAQADPLAQVLTAAHFYVTGRRSPGNENSTWQLLFTHCAATANKSAAKACNRAAASADKPQVTRNIDVTGADFHFKGYRDSTMHVKTDQLVCDSVIAPTTAALKAITNASKAHAKDKAGKVTNIPDSTNPVFTCTTI